MRQVIDCQTEEQCPTQADQEEFAEYCRMQEAALPLPVPYRSQCERCGDGILILGGMPVCPTCHATVRLAG